MCYVSGYSDALCVCVLGLVGGDRPPGGGPGICTVHLRARCFLNLFPRFLPLHISLPFPPPITRCPMLGPERPEAVLPDRGYRPPFLIVNKTSLSLSPPLGPWDSSTTRLDKTKKGLISPRREREKEREREAAGSSLRSTAGRLGRGGAARDAR
jgi:hypothetical protein